MMVANVSEEIESALADGKGPSRSAGGNIKTQVGRPYSTYLGNSGLVPARPEGRKL